MGKGVIFSMTKQKTSSNNNWTRMIELLANHFGIRKSQIHLVQGAKSRDKLFESP